MASWTKVWILVMVAIQAYTCSGLNRQETGWVTKHLKRPSGVDMHRSRSRQLGETTHERSVPNGWRGTLIHPTYLQGTDNLTILHRIRRDVEVSKERAKVLDRRARNALYHRANGRKMLDFVSDVADSSGAYSMEFSIGTPPQKFSAIADTGSDLVWLQCSTCDLCFESNAKFDPSASSSYVPLGCPGCDILGNNQLLCTPNCQYTYRYGDQSTTQGDFSEDIVTLTNFNGTSSTNIANFQFGCGLKNQGSFAGSDGLVGLARGPISFTSQIAPYLNGSNKFSYCLLSRYDPEVERSPIIFGEAAETSANGTFNFTGMLEPYNTSVVPYYYVDLVGVTVGGTRLPIPVTEFQIDVSTGNGGSIFDSGTTYTILKTEAYQQVKKEFASILDTIYPQVDLLDLTQLELCYNITRAGPVLIPTLVFHFKDADFDLPGENIVIALSIGTDDTFMCLALLESTGLNIYGSFQQQNFLVLHDENNLRIGWTPADCKSL